MTQLEALQAAHRVQMQLLQAQQTLDILELKEPTMAVSPQVAALIAEFDTATNAIAARIQKILSNPTTSLSAEEQSALQAEVDKLTVLGQDPANPVPAA